MAALPFKVTAREYIMKLKKKADLLQTSRTSTWCLVLASAVVWISGNYASTKYYRRGDSEATATSYLIISAVGFFFFLSKGIQLFAEYIEELVQSMQRRGHIRRIRSYSDQTRLADKSPLPKLGLGCPSLPCAKNPQGGSELLNSVPRKKSRVPAKKKPCPRCRDVDMRSIIDNNRNPIPKIIEYLDRLNDPDADVTPPTSSGDDWRPVRIMSPFQSYKNAGIRRFSNLRRPSYLNNGPRDCCRARFSNLDTYPFASSKSCERPGRKLEADRGTPDSDSASPKGAS